MALQFAYGFEDASDESILYRYFNMGYWDSTHSSILTFMDPAQDSYRYIQIKTTQSGATVRGLNYRDFQVNNGEIWFGARLRSSGSGSAGLTRTFLFAGTRDNQPYRCWFSLAIDPNTINGIYLDERSSSTDWGNQSVGLSIASQPTNGFVWEPDKWYFVAVGLKQEATYVRAVLMVDGQELVNTSVSTSTGNIPISALNDLTQLSLDGFESNSSTLVRWVFWDDFWVADEYLPNFRVMPTKPQSLGTYTQGTPVGEVNILDTVSHFPENDNTFTSLGQDQKLSFNMEDLAITVSPVYGIRLKIRVAGPTTFAVFFKKDLTESLWENVTVDSANITGFELSSTLNPFTGAPWKQKDLEDIEIGFQNGALEEATPSTPPT